MISPLITRPKKYYRPVKRDPQRHRVYTMERPLIGQSVFTITSHSHLQDVVSHVCKKFKVEEPKLNIVREKGRTFGWHDENGITLNENFHGCNTFTLLHELAHHICDQKLKKPHEDHGVEFVNYYMTLMHDYRIIPRYVFKLMADRNGIRY